MTVLSAWRPATAYAKGATVRPNAAQGSVPVPLVNGGFESGDTAWTKDAGWAISTGDSYEGTHKGIYTGTGAGTIKGSGTYAATAGQIITATIKAKVLDATDGATAFLKWYDANSVLVSTTTGLESNVESGVWMQLSVAGQAPANTAYVVFGVEATRTVGASVMVDDARWDYAAPLEARRMAYRAAQDSVGVSGVVEPAWPTTLGARITDGTVIWEAVEVSWIEWTTRPLLESGLTEPVWPTSVGGFVSDGTINWECTSRRVEDENCPQSKVVAIIASKVFAADRDIVRFSATANPLDWTSREDAGYLPTGLQQSNANDLAVLQPYRGNLGGWNANVFQMWQVDPDPTNMALLDQMDGVGSTHTLAATAVGNDLYYLAAPGVRSVGIANAAENLQAGDVGMPIDVLVQAAITQSIIDGTKALSTYWPGMGQYWLTFGDDGVTAGAGGAIALACPANISAIVGEAYSYTYVATGGTAPYTFSVVSGTLPPGLTLDEDTGVLSGTPTTAGSYSFGVQVADALGVVAFCGWAAAVLEDEAEVVDLAWRWLGTGQTIAGTRASIRPMDFTMVWTGVADSEVLAVNTTSSRAVQRYGDKMFAIVNNDTCRVADVSAITTWGAGPTGLDLATVGVGLGHTSVFGDRLWVACKDNGVSYLTTPADAAFTTITNMLASFPSFATVEAITGNGTNALCMNAFGAFVKSSDSGGAWSAGADLFGTGNRFYTSYGALDSNGSRALAAGGETGIRAEYTDNNGASFTASTVPVTSGQIPNQVRYCGSNRWLIACRDNATASDGLFKSVDNGVSFTAVTLPAAIEFGIQSKQNIAVDSVSGRVVIAGTEIGTGTRKYYWSDDLITWNAISIVGTEAGGMTEVYPIGVTP